MKQLFRDQCREVARTSGPAGLLAFTARTTMDWLISVVREQQDQEVVMSTSSVSDVPVFFTFDDARPRPRILIQGSLASLVVFAAIAFATSLGHPNNFRTPLLGLTYESRPPIAHAVKPEPPGFWARLLSRLNLRPNPNASTAAAPSNAANPPRPPATKAREKREEEKTWREWLRQPRQVQIPERISDPESATPPPPAIVALKIPARLLRRCVGKYVIDPPIDLKIAVTMQHGQLLLNIPDMPQIPLIAVSSTKFLPGVPYDAGRWVEFTMNQKGRITQLALVDGGGRFEAHRKRK